MTLAEWSPSVDIGENDKEFIGKAQLPDVKKEDIKVSVEDGTLSISGERKAKKEKKGLKFHRLERAYGRFERCFTLPDEADPDKNHLGIRGGHPDGSRAEEPERENHHGPSSRCNNAGMRRLSGDIRRAPHSRGGRRLPYRWLPFLGCVYTRQTQKRQHRPTPQ